MTEQVGNVAKAAFVDGLKGHGGHGVEARPFADRAVRQQAAIGKAAFVGRGMHQQPQSLLRRYFHGFDFRDDRVCRFARPMG
ncbi:hypothetical protein D3C87_2042390 [compost metagenome]